MGIEGGSSAPHRTENKTPIYLRGDTDMSLSYGALDAAESCTDDMKAGESLNAESAKFQNIIDARRKKLIPATITTITLFILTTGLIVLSDVWTSSSSTMYQVQSSLKSKIVKIEKLVVSSVYNDYGLRNSSLMLPYKFLVGSFLIEPYKETSIELVSPIVGCFYNWTMTNKIKGLLAANGTMSNNGNITVFLTNVGEYDFAVSEECGNISTSNRQLNMSVWVKYVRRELSTLNDQDREEFLDAFHTLWTVSTTDGMVLYGERYKSVNYFATLHNDAGGNPVCDLFHGGLGFLNNHMYLSAYLEQSLQLVNPKVALHYMEYNKYFESDMFEKHMSNQLDGGNWTDILTSKFFGASDPYTGRIIDGRWENASLPTMTTQFLINEGIDPDHTFFPSQEKEWLVKSAPHLSSPYGLLRSPWNYNPSPLVTRYGSVFGIDNISLFGMSSKVVMKLHSGVRCDDYERFFRNVKDKPLEVYLMAIEDDTHGIFHFTFGGVGGTPATEAIASLRDDYNFTYSNIASLAVSAQAFYKKNLALNHIYPVNCTADPWQNETLLSSAFPGSKKGPKCDFADEFYESEDTLNVLTKMFFFSDVDQRDSVVSRISAMEFEDRKSTMKIIADMFPYDGDLAGSGAALDPLFWVAHGAVERVFQKSLFKGIFSDTNYSSFSHCSGHASTATKYWLKGFYFVDPSVVAEEYTNSQLTSILNPTSDEYRDLVNFVYDTSSFDWCDGSESWFE